MIQFLPLLALLTSAATPPENWVVIGTEGEATLSLDKDSLRDADGLRHFRLKMVEGEAVGVADMVADCKAGWVEGRHSELNAPGQPPVIRDIAPGERNRMPTDDEIGQTVLKQVCG